MAERDDDEDGKNKNASALSALGASKGGKERAKRLSPEQRKAIATSAAITRWGMEPVRAVCDGFLKIGDIELACANLPDGRRVIAEITMLQALKRGYSGYYSQRDAAAPAGSAVPPRYLSPAFLRPFISEELKALQPIPYVTKSGVLAKGVEASAVPQICEVWLKARDAGKLNDVQLRTAAQAEIILRGLARVGITALIDEATGFQEERERNALAKILERFIAKELQPWAKTFPMDYYREIYRLRNWTWPPKSKTHNSNLGKYTNDLVYDRLAPGVREELHKLTPRNPKGRLKHKLFQHLTEDTGHPKLREHLGSVVMAMKVSKNWADFMATMNKHLKKWPKGPLLPFGEETKS
jgi:hypothetical protein